MIDRVRLQTLCDVRDLLADSVSKPMVLDDVARQVSYSPFHLHRLFTSVFQQTPHEFVTGERLAKARMLLRTTEMPVWMVGFEAGYASTTTFVGWFRSHTGCSPLEYRRQAHRSYQLGRFWAPVYIPSCCFKPSWFVKPQD